MNGIPLNYMDFIKCFHASFVKIVKYSENKDNKNKRNTI
jgi:hypothetical protein